MLGACLQLHFSNVHTVLRDTKTIRQIDHFSDTDCTDKYIAFPGLSNRRNMFLHAHNFYDNDFISLVRQNYGTCLLMNTYHSFLLSTTITDPFTVRMHICGLVRPRVREEAVTGQYRIGFMLVAECRLCSIVGAKAATRKLTTPTFARVSRHSPRLTFTHIAGSKQYTTTRVRNRLP